MFRRAIVLAAACVLALSACAGPAATPASSPASSDVATASPTAASAAAPTPAASAAPTATPIAIRPGEPWIATGWNHLYLVRPDGTDPHVLVPELDGPASDGDFGDPDWSPDGSRIAFDRWTGDRIGIWIADADGSGAREVGTCADPCLQLDYPAWSPDGSRLLLVRYDRTGGMWSHTAIQVLDLASGAQRTILETHDETVTYRYPRWSPDGTSVVFQLETYPNGQQVIGEQLSCVLAVIDVPDDGLAKPRIITQPALWAGYPDWSPSGDLIVFSTYDLSLFQDTDDVSNLYTIRPDGTGRRQLTPFKAGETRATQPAWSSGGARIIFTAVGQPRGSNRLVAFADADGSNVVVTSISGTHSKLRPTP